MTEGIAMAKKRAALDEYLQTNARLHQERDEIWQERERAFRCFDPFNPAHRLGEFDVPAELLREAASRERVKSEEAQARYERRMQDTYARETAALKKLGAVIA